MNGLLAQLGASRWQLTTTHCKLVSGKEQVVDAVAEWGELLFGRRLRLRVLLWVEEQEDPFNQSQAAMGVAYSSSGEVAKELQRCPFRGHLSRIGAKPGGMIAQPLRDHRTGRPIVVSRR